MSWSLSFVITSLALGVGLAMDAFSVSLANGLNEPGMRPRRMCAMAGTFAFFQFLMPMIGWVCVHTVVQIFSSLERFIPWVALILLLFIGGNMLRDGIKHKCGEDAGSCPVGFAALMLQGVATSIDALSVGFTIADYSALAAFVCCLLIAAVTFAICMGGIIIGRRFGTCMAGKASILGGVILILIGLEIFITGMF